MGEYNFDLRRFIELNELNLMIYTVPFSTDFTVEPIKLDHLNFLKTILL